MAKKFTAKIGKVAEPYITPPQFNAAITMLSDMQSLVHEELRKHLTEEEVSSMSYIDILWQAYHSSIAQCISNPATSEALPNTMSDLRSRFELGPETFIQELIEGGSQLDDDTKELFKKVYSSICYRIDNAMVHGQRIGYGPGLPLIH